MLLTASVFVIMKTFIF